MAQRQPDPTQTRRVRGNDHVLLVPVDGPDRDLAEMIIEDETSMSIASDEAIVALKSLAGAWSDLDWEDLESDLRRVRHESAPSPVLDDL